MKVKKHDNKGDLKDKVVDRIGIFEHYAKNSSEVESSKLDSKKLSCCLSVNKDEFLFDRQRHLPSGKQIKNTNYCEKTLSARSLENIGRSEIETVRVYSDQFETCPRSPEKFDTRIKSGSGSKIQKSITSKNGKTSVKEKKEEKKTEKSNEIKEIFERIKRKRIENDKKIEKERINKEKEEKTSTENKLKSEEKGKKRRKFHS